MKNHIIGSLSSLAALACQPSIVSAQSAAQARIPTQEPARIERHVSGGLDRVAEDRMHLERAELHAASGSVLSVRGQSFGLGQFEGELWGAGPDFKAHFTEAGIEFTPALGRAVESNHGLTFSLESVRRGDVLLYAGSTRVPVADGNAVRYTLAPGLTESYAVCRDGVEQSYLFESLPPGSGDLVVRGRLHSDFPGSRPDGSGGLCFELPGIGGVGYGAVTGIDAKGTRAAGELRFDGDALELVLPAAFVDSAALPLVLDPLLGANIGIDVGTADDRDADIAYDALTNDYLFVWEHRFSGFDLDIYAQRVDGSGAMTGSTIFIEPIDAIVAINPTVANCRLSGRFLVAWQEGTSALGPWHIEAELVNASTGATSNSVALSTDTLSDLDPDAGGDSTLTDDEVVVTYQEQSTGIKARYVTVPLTGDPVLSTTITIMSSANVSKPAISKSGGSAGRYLIVWQRFSSPTPPVDHDLWRALIDRNGTILVPQAIVATTTGTDEEDPDVDGDGTNFMIVYEREAAAGSGDNDIDCRMATYTGGSSLTLSAATEIEGDANDDEINPAVGYAGFRYLVAWADETFELDYDVRAVGMSISGSTVIEGELGVDNSSSGVDQIEIATQSSGGALLPADGAWMAWGSMETVPGFEGDIEGQAWEAIAGGGAVADLGGGCGGGGSTGVNGPVALGNSLFAVTLTGADPSATLGLMNISGGGAPIACGTCLSNPLFLVVKKTVVAGAATIAPVPIPSDLSLLGGVVQVNWTVLPTTSSPCPIFSSISNSNLLSLTIGT